MLKRKGDVVGKNKAQYGVSNNCQKTLKITKLKWHILEL